MGQTVFCFFVFFWGAHQNLATQIKSKWGEERGFDGNYPSTLVLQPFLVFCIFFLSFKLKIWFLFFLP